MPNHNCMHDKSIGQAVHAFMQATSIPLCSSSLLIHCTFHHANTTLAQKAGCKYYISAKGWQILLIDCLIHLLYTTLHEASSLFTLL